MLVDKTSNDYVCHKEEVLGTRLTKKVCRSRSEEADIKAETRQALDRMQNQSAVARGN